MNDKRLLDLLRVNDTTNAIAKLELQEDIDILKIMNYERTLRGNERHALDKTLVEIAHDRAKYREGIIISTNEPASLTNEPASVRRMLARARQKWAEDEMRIQAFLDNIASQRHD